MEILRVEHVGLTYQAKNGEVNAFEDISFAVEEDVYKRQFWRTARGFR